MPFEKFTWGRHRCVFLMEHEQNSTPYIYLHMCACVSMYSWIASPDMDINVLQHVHSIPMFSIPSVGCQKIPILSVRMRSQERSLLCVQWPNKVEYM